MSRITIPCNQYPKTGEFMLVLVDKAPIYLKATQATSSAGYDETFLASEFNPQIHGFRGIIEPLTALMATINTIKS